MSDEQVFERRKHCRAHAYLVESFERFLDALQAQVEFLLRDDEGRSEANAVCVAWLFVSDDSSEEAAAAERREEGAHVDVSRLGQDALALHDERQVPRRSTLGALALVNHDRVQQTFAAHFRDPAAFRADSLQRAEAGAHLFAKAGGARRQVFVDDDFERGLGDGARERVLFGSARGVVSKAKVFSSIVYTVA